MVTDTHCFRDRYGDFAFWSVTRSSFGNSDSDREMGTWEARGGRVGVRVAGRLLAGTRLLDLQ